MFKGINNRINLTFETDVNKGADQIMTLIEEKKKEHTCYSIFAHGHIDFKEFKINDKVIEVLRKPYTFWPFRPFGKIKFTLHQTSSTRTKIKYEVMTGNNLVPLFITIQVIGVVLWSTGWILTTKHLDGLTRYSTPLVIFIVFNGISYFKFISDKKKLVNYSVAILNMIRK